MTSALGTSELTFNDPESADVYTYENAPVITSVADKSPTSGAATSATGPTAGNTLVEITGTDFTDATAVYFGSTPAEYFYQAATPTGATAALDAASPAGAVGNVDIRVATPVGESALTPNDHFLYNLAPTVNAISPAGGPPAGGTAVTIRGSNLNGATAVKFGNGSASSLKVISNTEITATSSAGTLGPVAVTVTTPNGNRPARPSSTRSLTRGRRP